MKKLYLIGGTMGVGKTTVSKQLCKELPNSVLLDGDWCWNASNTIICDETKDMVMNNICYLLNNYIKCTYYQNIILCWVMHEQSIIDTIISKLDISNVEIISISLLVDEDNLRNRLIYDINNNIRKNDILDKSIKRIDLYNKLNTIKIDTNNRNVSMIVNDIKNIEV